MGFRDKMAARVAAKMGGMPDYRAIITEGLGEDGPCTAYAFVAAEAYKRDSGTGNDVGSFLLRKAVDAVSDTVAQNKHIGGDEGSIARSLPRDAGMLALALGPGPLTFWDFGMDGQAIPPTLRLRIGRDSIVSLTDTGQRAQGGVQVARLTFADESFFDYRLVTVSGPEFWTEAASVSS